MCNAQQLRWINFNSYYLEAKQSFSMVEKKNIQASIMNKSNYHSCAFFFACGLQLTLCGIWMSVSEVRVAAEANAADQKKIKVTARGTDVFWTSLQMLKRAPRTMSGECRLRETARASCSGWDTIACLPAWARANSKASVSCLTPSPQRSLNFQFTTAHNCLQQPNFIFYSQILSHIILYIALGP